MALMRHLGTVILLAVATVAAPTAGRCGDSLADALLMGAAYSKSDLRPLGPGVTAMRFVPGQGLVRSGQAATMVQPPAMATEGGLTAYVETPAAALDPDTTPGASLGLVAPIRLGSRARAMQALHIVDGRVYGGRERWFLFAAAGGKALGYNFIRGDKFDAGGRGLALDRGGFIGQAQAGVGWRRGAYQMTFSYVHTQITVRLHDVDDVDEDRIAFTWTRFSLDSLLPSRRAFAEKTLPRRAP